MTVDYIIVGQGISGTWVAYYLLKENKSIIVFDKQNLQSASNIAGGLINPVTGRRVVTTWMAEKLLPFVLKEYNAISEPFNTEFISQKNILVFPSAPDLLQAFRERMNENNSYIKRPSLKKEELASDFNFPFDVLEISPCYVIQVQELLRSYREYLQKENVLLDATYDEGLLTIKNGFIQYKNIKAKKIIYAGGIQSAQSRYWINLPFVQNKGQALILEADDLNTSYIYKFGQLTVIPLRENLWWAGSSNELSFQTTAPTEDFYKRTASSLKAILKKEFKIKEHWSSLRPATVERRPFAGIHPLYKEIAILNGMGSKGCSLAPWFAKELAENLVHAKPIDPLTDVQRFSKVLNRIN